MSGEFNVLPPHMSAGLPPPAASASIYLTNHRSASLLFGPLTRTHTHNTLGDGEKGRRSQAHLGGRRQGGAVAQEGGRVLQRAEEAHVVLWPPCRAGAPLLAQGVAGGAQAAVRVLLHAHLAAQMLLKHNLLNGQCVCVEGERAGRRIGGMGECVRERVREKHQATEDGLAVRSRVAGSSGPLRQQSGSPLHRRVRVVVDGCPQTCMNRGYQQADG